MEEKIKGLSNKDLQELKFMCGDSGWTEDSNEKKQYLSEQRGLFKSFSPIILKPKNTNTVAKILKYCSRNSIPVVPQGGNTGLVGGTVCGKYDEILISLEKINKVRAISESDSVITIEAGTTLDNVQKLAKSINKFFPLSLASEGTCQIGGNLATNAGGVHVIKYGNTRDLVLGLEVVLANGKIINGLKTLRKDNSGYNLNQLFVGSEGTLGIITAVSLKLFPLPKEIRTAIISVNTIKSAIELMEETKNIFSNNLSAFEFFSEFSLGLTLKHIPNTDDPFDKKYPWYILIDIEIPQSNNTIFENFQDFLIEKITNDNIIDGVIAKNQSEREKLWRIRESIPYAQTYEGASIKHDISVPIKYIPNFLDEVLNNLRKLIKGIRPCVFGHVGDGNIHLNFSSPERFDDAKFLNFTEDINKVVFDTVKKYDGSISAEHGIGLLKKDTIINYKDELEIELMRKIKKIFDPKNILNPGKLI